MKRRKHQWSQSPGDMPAIGFVPTCIHCNASADDPNAGKTCAEYEKHRDEYFKRELAKHFKKKP
jgi:hypothetical protein